MKPSSKNPNRHRSERGFFLVIVLLIITTIMLLYLSANGRRLSTLKKEIRQVEQKQLLNLNRSSTVVATNSPAEAIPSTAVK